MKVDVTIAGVSPLLMHRFPLEDAVGFEKWDREKQAEWAAYREPGGELYVPSENVLRCLVSAGTAVKGKGRGNLSRLVAGGLSIVPTGILLLGQRAYEIDSRIVKNPMTRGRHVRNRPRLDHWQLSFALEWDEALMKPQEIRSVVDVAGQRFGLLDYRPETRGPFGRFMVVSWQQAAP